MNLRYNINKTNLKYRKKQKLINQKLMIRNLQIVNK